MIYRVIVIIFEIQLHNNMGCLVKDFTKKISLFNKFIFKTKIRSISSQVKPKYFSDVELPATMSAWILNSNHNGISSLELTKGLDIPVLQKPNDILIKVNAASINNLDVMMTGIFLYNFKVNIIVFLLYCVSAVNRRIWS
jgi:hypothetical protein